MNPHGAFARLASLPGYFTSALAIILISTSLAEAQATCAKVDVVKIQEYAGVIQNLVPWVASEQGIFKKHCLDAKMVQIPSAPGAFAATVQGGVDFVSTSPDPAFIIASKGLDIRMVAFMNDTVHYVLVVGKHVPLPHKSEGFPAVMKDLVGKKIGVVALGSTVDNLARANFLAAGLDPNQATWIAYGPTATAIAGLQNGSMDAVELYADGMDIAVAAAGGTIVGDLRDRNVKTIPQIGALRGASLMWGANAAFVEKNPDVVRRFFLANNEAVEWIREPKNFEAIVKLVGEKAPSPAGVADPNGLLRERVKRYVPQVNSKVSMRALKAWSDWDVSLKRIPGPANLDRIIWEGARTMVGP